MESTQIKLNKEETDLLMLLQEKLTCAKACLKIYSNDFSEEEMKFFYQATIDSIGEYQWMYNDVWSNIIKKYNLEINHLYTMKDGVVYE